MWDRRRVVGLRWKGRMVGGGVEATGGRDEFASVFHTEKHFAPGLVVVAGGGEDGGDGLGGGAVM